MAYGREMSTDDVIWCQACQAYEEWWTGSRYEKRDYAPSGVWPSFTFTLQVYRVVTSLLSLLMCVQIGEARALYNLGNVCHARAKAVEQKAGNISCCPADVQEHLLQAVDFYK